MAKQCATVDIISGGRFGINVVAGWNQPEIEMFGADLMAHEARYRHLAEWMEIVLRLWTAEEEFDFTGEFFTIRRSGSRPKPVQRPRPPIMNAASSGIGREFAVRVADMCFVQITSDDPAERRAQIETYKQLARRAHRRDIQVWTMATVVHRETTAEAEAFLRQYAVEHADGPSVDAWLGTLLVNAENMSRPEMAESPPQGRCGRWRLAGGRRRRSNRRRDGRVPCLQQFRFCHHALQNGRQIASKRAPHRPGKPCIHQDW